MILGCSERTVMNGDSQSLESGSGCEGRIEFEVDSVRLARDGWSSGPHLRYPTIRHRMHCG